MENKSIIELIKILDNNQKNNIILIGTDAGIFDDAVIIPANIASSNLGIGINDRGQYLYPTWYRKLLDMDDKENIYLIIENIDTISTDEQNKFFGMLKYKQINGGAFPNNTQIILTTKGKDRSKINTNILSLSLII